MNEVPSVGDSNLNNPQFNPRSCMQVNGRALGVAVLGGLLSSGILVIILVAKHELLPLNDLKAASTGMLGAFGGAVTFVIYKNKETFFPKESHVREEQLPGATHANPDLKHKEVALQGAPLGSIASSEAQEEEVDFSLEADEDLEEDAVEEEEVQEEYADDNDQSSSHANPDVDAEQVIELKRALEQSLPAANTSGPEPEKYADENGSNQTTPSASAKTSPQQSPSASPRGSFSGESDSVSQETQPKTDVETTITKEVVVEKVQTPEEPAKDKEEAITIVRANRPPPKSILKSEKRLESEEEIKAHKEKGIHWQEEDSGKLNFQVLLKASEKNDFELAKKCLESGISVNNRTDGWSPIHYAAKNGNLQMIKLFLKQADIHLTKELKYSKEFEPGTAYDIICNVHPTLKNNQLVKLLERRTQKQQEALLQARNAFKEIFKNRQQNPNWREEIREPIRNYYELLDNAAVREDRLEAMISLEEARAEMNSIYTDRENNPNWKTDIRESLAESYALENGKNLTDEQIDEEIAFLDAPDEDEEVEAS